MVFTCEPGQVELNTKGRETITTSDATFTAASASEHANPPVSVLLFTTPHMYLDVGELLAHALVHTGAESHVGEGLLTLLPLGPEAIRIKLLARCRWWWCGDRRQWCQSSARLTRHGARDELSRLTRASTRYRCGTTPTTFVQPQQGLPFR